MFYITFLYNIRLTTRLYLPLLNLSIYIWRYIIFQAMTADDVTDSVIYALAAPTHVQVSRLQWTFRTWVVLIITLLKQKRRFDRTLYFTDQIVVTQTIYI
jgi:hypothetical protein